jgi:chromosome segregation protein
MQEQASVQAEADMSVWQEKWDQFRRDFHKIHESAQIENRGIEHIERQLRQSDQRREKFQVELKTLDTSAFDEEIINLEQQADAKIQEHAATQEQMEAKGDEILELRDSIEQQSTQLDEKRTEVQNLRGRLSALEALQQNV